MAAEDVSPKGGVTLQIGDMTPDGTVYAGISPDTKRPMYATAADAPLVYTFDEAQEYASSLHIHGHNDWRVPTKRELKMLFRNREAIGGFDLSGSDPAGWYWSSSPGYKGYSLTAWNHRFSDGHQLNDFKDYQWSVRCVR